MNRAQLRAIASSKDLEAYNRAVTPVEPPKIRIGDRDPMTGKDEVIYPDGGKEIAGKRLFNSSVPVGRDVPWHVSTAARASGDGIVMLDAKNHKPEEEGIIEQPKTGFNAQTYIIAYIDRSGSMEDEVSFILQALEELKTPLKEQIYKTDEKLEKYFQIKGKEPVIFPFPESVASEQWLYWFGLDPREKNTEPNRVVVLAFINESSPVYHDTPRVLSQEPTATFKEDLIFFKKAEYKKRKFFKGKVYSIKYPLNPKTEEAFSAHVADAMEAKGAYQGLSKLTSLNCSYQLGLDAGTTAEFYLKDIKKLLGLRL